jgi:8-amino-7-oxononanoate synthase
MNMTFLEKDLAQMEALGLRRTLKSIDSPQGTEIVFNGRKVLNFSSNDYLGLSNDARIKRAAVEGIEQYGLGAGASRLICGNMSPHEKLEAQLALVKNAESALVFSSGYMANTGTISALMGRNDIVLSDKLNHASIIDGIVLSRAKLLRYPHADIQALEEMLKALNATQKKLIVTDSVFSMDGDKAPLQEIVDLARRYEAMVMVDEAHATGILGDHGGGLVEELGLQAQVDIQMGTLSKAVGALGAYVCGANLLREYLINKSRAFVYTTALPPALALAACAALQIIHQDDQLRRQLKDNAQYLRSRLKAMGFDTMNSTTPIIPVLIKDSARALDISRHLFKQGVFVQAIRPPTVPVNTARLRLTVTAAHTRDNLEQLLNALRTL